ncbi:glutamate--tRNA ligase family protein [Cohnella suwonensis]|uniref:Glutamate--tRNA ligase family protein n=1 Tax=Cohnella suwonensis TaxID=696072 RepID=A0ABW0LQ63_9BACL
MTGENLGDRPVDQRQGYCRSLTEEERRAKATGKEPAWRFPMPERTIAFDVLMLGAQSFDGAAPGDFVVKRADGMFGYQLAVSVDDAAMGITDVLRAWLRSRRVYSDIRKPVGTALASAGYGWLLFIRSRT